MYNEEDFEIEPRKQYIFLSLLVTLRLVFLNFEWLCIKKYCSKEVCSKVLIVGRLLKTKWLEKVFDCSILDLNARWIGITIGAV